MKLVRFGARGEERHRILDPEGEVRDLSGLVEDIDGRVIGPDGLARLAALDLATLPKAPPGARLGPCVGNIGKLVCVGLNYSDHAAEANMPVPEEPILFMKATTAVNGPNDPVRIPRRSMKTDWEVELGIVIGSRARYIEKADALEHVAGYCVVNDVSEREFQLERSGQWVKGKSADTFAPIGPWLVTRDEVPDPQNLRLWLEVNGERFQDGSTATMIFGVVTLVSYISQFLTLEPGDVISTGTPPGVGQGQNPPRFLCPGDRMRLGVEDLGEQTQEIQGAD